MDGDLKRRRGHIKWTTIKDKLHLIIGSRDKERGGWKVLGSTVQGNGRSLRKQGEMRDQRKGKVYVTLERHQRERRCCLVRWASSVTRITVIDVWVMKTRADRLNYVSIKLLLLFIFFEQNFWHIFIGSRSVLPLSHEHQHGSKGVYLVTCDVEVPSAVRTTLCTDWLILLTEGRCDSAWTTHQAFLKSQRSDFIVFISEEQSGDKQRGQHFSDSTGWRKKSISEQMLLHGYQRNAKQCREKEKKNWNVTTRTKDSHARSARWTNWRWFDKTDAINGQRPHFIWNWARGNSFQPSWTTLCWAGANCLELAEKHLSKHNKTIYHAQVMQLLILLHWCFNCFHNN